MSQGFSYKLVTHSEQLIDMVATLEQEKFLAVDTESNSLFAYRERVCLIQFSNAKEDYLVDPLSINDLSPLAKIFNDPGIEKIFHAAEYDLIVLQRDFGFGFSNLFDTMVASRILGRKKVGLGSLLDEEFGVKLSKRFQRADWGKRPLSADLLDYACLDTHYLIELRKRLKSELKKKRRWAIAKENFARLPNNIHAPDTFPDGDIWRIKGVRDLNSRQAAILAELASYRNDRAKKADLPLFKVIGDNTLTAIASTAPRNEAELQVLEGMTKGQLKRHGQALLEAIRRGVQAEPLKRPRKGFYDEDYVERLEALRTWRKKAARKMEVESDVILPRDIMEKLARDNPQSVEEFQSLLASLPWRREKFGDQIWRILNSN